MTTRTWRDCLTPKELDDLDHHEDMYHRNDISYLEVIEVTNRHQRTGAARLAAAAAETERGLAELRGQK